MASTDRKYIETARRMHAAGHLNREGLAELERLYKEGLSSMILYSTEREDPETVRLAMADLGYVKANVP